MIGTRLAAGVLQAIDPLRDELHSSALDRVLREEEPYRVKSCLLNLRCLIEYLVPSYSPRKSSFTSWVVSASQRDSTMLCRMIACSLLNNPRTASLALLAS